VGELRGGGMSCKEDAREGWMGGIVEHMDEIEVEIIGLGRKWEAKEYM
jgi:hypothetical protein